MSISPPPRRRRLSLARARSPPHTARTAERRARPLARRRGGGGKRIAMPEGAATSGHARSDAHPPPMADRRRRARASPTQAANTPQPIPAPAWRDASAQQARARACVPQGARGATRRELGRRPRAPDLHGSRGVHRGGCRRPRDDLSEVARAAAKETARRLQGGCRLRTVRRQAAHYATPGSAPCDARHRTVPHLVPHRAPLSPARCDA